jgi:hypothetical protein
VELVDQDFQKALGFFDSDPFNLAGLLAEYFLEFGV